MTASPIQLVVMLYDGAGRFLRQAIAAHDTERPLDAHVPLTKAVAIIEELLATLDVEAGADIAKRLQGIYVFCLKELAQARMEQSPVRLHEVRVLLADLRDGWAQIAAQQG